MGRNVTADIKNRRKITIYPSHELIEAYVLQHISLQSRLGRHIDKTIHCDAVLTVGIRHIDEVIQEVERITASTRS